MVVSEIRPILSPKHAPPAIAQAVRIGSPPTMWLSHINIGAHAAKVPHDVPVATDRMAVHKRPTTATVFAVTPSESAIFTTAAPTPELMNTLAIAYANMRMKRATRILLTLFIAASRHCWNLSFSTRRAMITA